MSAIIDYIKRPGVFDPEEISAMSDAYDSALRSFSTPPPKSVREVIAATIIALAGSGESDPQKLSEKALSASGLEVQ
ncbi:MAG: hypothetical protein ACREB8_00120 [Pseudolabrys sp.]